MKKTINHLAIILIVCFSIAGCKKDKKVDETTKNYLKVGGTEYDISKGILENYGEVGSAFQIDLNLVSSDIIMNENNGEITTFSGIGHEIYFDFFSSSSDKLALGDYAYDNTWNAGTFDYADYVLNWNYTKEPDFHNINYIEITSGSVKILKNGPEYELTFSGKNSDNTTITGYYKGVLKYYDYSKKKSSMAKPKRKL